MTQLYTPFSDNPTLTEHWHTGSGSFSIETSGLPPGATGGAALKVVLTTDDRYAIAWEEAGTPTGDVELLIKWQVNATSSGTGTGTARAIICGAGDSTSETGYFLSHRVTGAGTLQSLAKYDAAAATTLDSVQQTLSINTWYRTRIQKTGTTIRARTWADGDAEPGTWHVSATDAALSGGWVGIGQFFSNQTLWVDFISVGTGGDAAPAPAEQTVNAAFISSGSTLYPATVRSALVVNAAFISSGSQLFTATITPGEVSVSAAFITSGTQLFTATVYDPDRIEYSGKARRRVVPQFWLAVYGRLPDKGAPHELTIPPNTQLNWTSGLPGGWLSAQVGMPEMAGMLAAGQRRMASWLLPRGLDMPPKGHVEIWESGTGLVFEGQLEGGERVGRNLRGLDIDGYGVALTQVRQFEGGNATDQTTAGRILRSLVNGLVPHVTIGEIADTGTLHTYAEFARMTPMQALDMLAKEGGDGVRYIWHVYYRTLSFLPATVDGDATYQIPYDERVTVREDYRNIASRARMYYRDAATGVDRLSAQFINQATENDYGRIDRLVEGGQVSDAGASAFLQTELARAAEPVYSITILRGPGEGMEGIGGDTPAYRVLPGETVEIDGLGTFLIANARHAQVDGGGIQTQLEIGEPVTRSEAAVFERLLDAETAIRAGLDVTTRTRWGR